MGSASLDVHYRTAVRDDLPGIGRVYLRAFPDTLRDLRSPRLTVQAVADVMGACLAAERDCIQVAVAGGDGPVVGYVLGISDISRVSKAVLLRGLWVLWILRWILGRYGLPIRSGLHVLTDKLSFRKTWRGPTLACPARILSIAVDPEWQRRGVGRGLLERAVDKLRHLGVARVRLDVRPENAAARMLYEHFGFREVGEFRDTRGPWTVMVMELGEREQENA